MSYWQPVPDEVFRENLTKVVGLLTPLVADDFRRAVNAGIALKSSRPTQPRRVDLPRGHCTFTYECNRTIEHWRYLHDRDTWIPVCRNHRLRR